MWADIHITYIYIYDLGRPHDLSILVLNSQRIGKMVPHPQLCLLGELQFTTNPRLVVVKVGIITIILQNWRNLQNS